nr:RecName: Full=Zinc metalloproteinase-disintegrin-like; AltName: Full=Snake venom metalloproteinase; Short=SVMP [Micrurus corallinus]
TVTPEQDRYLQVKKY